MGPVQVPEENRTTRTFDPSTTAPSTALIEALAIVEGVDATRLFDGDASIHDFVDPDALDRLLTGDACDDVAVSLTVEGRSVRVRSGVVTIRAGRRE